MATHKMIQSVSLDYGGGGVTTLSRSILLSHHAPILIRLDAECHPSASSSAAAGDVAGCTHTHTKKYI